jgi:hypothetical protein
LLFLDTFDYRVQGAPVLGRVEGLLWLGHAALHSNFPKQYAAASAELKKAAAQNHASHLSSYLMQMAVTTALTKAPTLAHTSHPK